MSSEQTGLGKTLGGKAGTRISGQRVHPACATLFLQEREPTQREQRGLRHPYCLLVCECRRKGDWPPKPQAAVAFPWTIVQDAPG